MRQILTEWRRFLKEEYEVTVNPSDYESYAEFKKDFELAAKNSAFVQVFLDTLVRLELRPLVQSLSEEERKTLFKDIKMSPFVPINRNFIQNIVIPNIPSDSALAKAGVSSDSFRAFDYLSFYVSYFTNKNEKKDFENQVSEGPSKFASLYWELFKKYPEEVPTISKIYKADTSTQNRRENIRTLNQDKINIRLEDIQKPNILDDVKIIEKLGKGAFGIVYSLEDGRALKVFSSSVDVNKDIERYEKIIDQVYKGEASLEDMHVFDYGKIGDSRYYYVLMPKIVPLSSTNAFDESAIFAAISISNKKVATLGLIDNFDDFKKNVLLQSALVYTMQKNKYANSNLSFDQAYLKYKDIVDKIIQAGWRAYSEFGGTDIHLGNIGFFPQKPDQFFYYDM